MVAAPGLCPVLDASLMRESYDRETNLRLDNTPTTLLLLRLVRVVLVPGHLVELLAQLDLVLIAQLLELRDAHLPLERRCREELHEGLDERLAQLLYTSFRE